MSHLSTSLHAPARQHTRRAVLKAAVALGATMVAPGIALGRPVRAKASKVGLLVPRSRGTSALGVRFAAGVALALRESGMAAAEPVVYGVSGLRAARTAAQLAEHGLPAVVGLLHPHTITAVATALAERGSLAVTASAGEAAVKAGRPAATVSLELTASQWVLGEWAGRQYGRRAALITSFYDCGFDAWRAFKHGFEYGGGDIVDEVVVNAPIGGPGPREAVARALAAGPDMLYLGASGKEADALLTALAGASPGVPLLVSPFGVDIDRPSRALAAELGVLSAIGRPANLAPDDVADFARRYAAAGGTVDDSLALLGYAAGLAALQRVDGRPVPASIEVRRLRSSGSAVAHERLAELPVPVDAAAVPGGARWTNPYLSR